MEDMDHALEGAHAFAVIFSKPGRGPSLRLESFHDRVDSIAVFELRREGMVDQFEPCLFFIALQGSVEEQLKPSLRRIPHYIMPMEECEEMLKNKGGGGDRTGDGCVEDLKVEETKAHSLSMAHLDTARSLTARPDVEPWSDSAD